MKKRVLLQVILFFSLSLLFSEGKTAVNFYGIVTSSVDSNMITITKDLFSAQLRSIPNVIYNDFQDTDFTKKASALDGNPNYFELLPSKENVLANETNLSFFAVIKKEEETEKWHCVYNVRNEESGKINSIEKIYDSYYKILTDAKITISSVIFLDTNTKPINIENTKSILSNAAAPLSLEYLSGTWIGEKTIAKTIIMRGGRGFVIFNNGASMNINVAISEENEKQIIKIVQSSKFNASFYPDVPRQEVLEYAEKAMPIEWTLMLAKNGNLEGSKKTLLVNESGKIAEELVRVSWIKKN